MSLASWSTFSRCDKPKCLQTSPGVPWGGVVASCRSLPTCPLHSEAFSEQPTGTSPTPCGLVHSHCSVSAERLLLP